MRPPRGVDLSAIFYFNLIQTQYGQGPCDGVAAPEWVQGNAGNGAGEDARRRNTLPARGLRRPQRLQRPTVQTSYVATKS